MRATNLSANIQFRVPPALVTTLAEGADKDCTTCAAFIRAAIVGRLRELGVSIGSAAAAIPAARAAAAPARAA
jgi:hypothetical protein